MTLNTESGSDDDAASSAISEVFDEDEQIDPNDEYSADLVNRTGR